MEPVYVARNPHEKAMQRALIQYRDAKNYDLVREALLKTGRQDLIGFERYCLIRPRKFSEQHSGKQHNIPEQRSGRQRKSGNRTSGRTGTIRNIHKRKKQEKKP